MNNRDHTSESFETIFWAKILKFFDADPESGMEKIRIRDKTPGSAALHGGKRINNAFHDKKFELFFNSYDFLIFGRQKPDQNLDSDPDSVNPEQHC
jgi:hypothetical protein